MEFGKTGLFGSSDQLDVLFQQTVNELLERYALSLGSRCQERQDVRIEMERRSQNRAGSIEPAAFGFQEIIFLFHSVEPSRYWRASLRVGRRAEMMRTAL